MLRIVKSCHENLFLQTKMSSQFCCEDISGCVTYKSYAQTRKGSPVTKLRVVYNLIKLSQCFLDSCQARLDVLHTVCKRQTDTGGFAKSRSRDR